MKNILRYLWYQTCKYVLILLPFQFFSNLIGFLTYKRFGYKYVWMNINNPQTFNEKIQFLKLHPAILNGTLLADKYRVREYIRQTIGEKYLVKLLGVWDDANQIDFDSLPNKFVLKANHGSGWNIICENKNTLDINKSRKMLNKWLQMNAYYLSREWQYKNINPVIICEEFLEYNIFDYKFFCFNGVPQYVQIDIDRFTNHSRAFYDMDWNLMPFNITYLQPQQLIDKPAQLEEMKTIAATLSKDIPFVRIDLYIHNNKIYFGEITLHPGGGYEPFNSYKYDVFMGSLINIPSIIK